MPSRRAFIQRSLAASALAACPLPARGVLAWPENRPAEPRRFFKILFDRTRPEGAAFGAEAARRGGPAEAVGLDVGGVWMNEIEPRWRRERVALAGLTDGAALFCLELLARDYGMGVVYRVRHSPAGDGHVRHFITGPVALEQWGRRLAAAGRGWGAQAAAMAMSCPNALLPDSRIDLLDLADGSGTLPASLFSWVIAPDQRERARALQASSPQPCRE
jgi:hypothetical protein